MRLFRRLLFCTLPVAIALSTTSCSREKPATPAHAKAAEVHAVRGIIRGPYSDGSITIEHEAVPNYMPAMTMPFNVEAADVQSLRPGDRVEFELRLEGDTSRATRFRKVGAAAEEAQPKAAPTAPVSRLRAGGTVPPFDLIDQDGEPFTADDLSGRHTVVTFIFTRCPVPEFCPLMARKFQALQTAVVGQKENSTAKVQLLSVTIDPEHDQPAVLRAYGESQHADFNVWRFVTGDRTTIDRLAKLFAVRAERNGGTLDHTLATALIGPDGRVVEIWRGNAWQPEEVLARLPSERP